MQLALARLRQGELGTRVPVDSDDEFGQLAAGFNLMASALQTNVTAQAQAQLGLAVTPLRTLTDRRATFACTPALVRPAGQIAAGLLAAGDYIAGPYPATLEGAVRSGLQAAGALGHGRAL